MQQQRGAGLGGMFRSLFRTVTPHLKKGLAHLGRRALTAGANALADMSDNNVSLKDALKKQAKNEFMALNPINMITASKKAVSSSKERKGGGASSSSSSSPKKGKRRAASKRGGSAAAPITL